MAQPIGLYRYNLLPSGKWIRLLELCSTSATDKVEFRLCQHKLEESPKYEAISYAWGDPEDRINVLCNGKVISVTKNLMDALRRLKLLDKTRLLWADAICINQSDEVEKGMQVRLMKAIYDKAMKVCIWLGGATAEMQPAFQLIPQLVTYATRENTHTSELPDSTSNCWGALKIFFSAAWFSRLWVIQEVCSHPCTVLCGEQEIMWTDVVLISRLLINLNADRRSIYPLPTNALRALQIDSAGRDFMSYDLLDTFRFFDCSDQRDKVYALLSFPPLCNFQQPIEPDYRKSVAEIFEEAATGVMKFRQNLGLLSSVEHDSNLDSAWPSWVPRWDHKRTTQILHNYTSGRTDFALPSFTFEPATLIASGIHVTTVTWCGSVISESSSHISSLETIRRPLQEWLSTYIPQAPDVNEDFLDRVAMTFTVGLDHMSDCPPRDMPKFRLDFLACTGDILTSKGLLGNPLRLAQNLSDQTRVGTPEDYYHAALRGCRNKRILCADDGSFGVGPRAAQPGDLVVLLYGSNAPSVLRPTGAYYQFVGECYIHEQMHGEAIEMAAKEPSLVEKFRIR